MGSRAELRAEVLPLAAIFLLPVVHSSIFFREFRTPQLAVTVVIGAACIAVALSQRPIRWLLRQDVLVQVGAWSLAGSLVLMAISAASGPDPYRSIVGHPHQGTGLGFWVLVLAIAMAASWAAGRTGEGPWISSAGAAGAVLLGLATLWAVGPRGLMQEFFVPLSPEGVPLAGLGNSTQLSAVLGAMAIMSLGSWWRNRRIRWLVLACSLLAYCVVAQSRVAVAVTLATMTLAVPFVIRRSASLVSRLAVSIMLTSVATTAQLVLVPALPQVASDLTVTSGDAPDEGDSSAAEPSGKYSPEVLAGGLRHRLALWRVGARSIAAEPFFGVGPANFVYAYRANVTESDIRDSPGRDVEEVFDGHMLPLELAVTDGLPAAILLIGGLAALALAGMRRRRGSGPSWVAWAAGLLAVAHMFQPLWVGTTGLMVILIGASSTIGPPVGSPEEPRRPRILGVVLGVLVTITGLFVGGSVVRSDLLLDVGELEWDREVLQRAVDADPSCDICLFALGKVRAWDHSRDGVGTVQWAIRPFRDAIRQHPRDSYARFRLGQSLLFLKEPELAVEPLQEARRLDPNGLDPMIAIIDALVRVGDPEGALPHAQKLARMTGTADAYGLLAFVAEGAGRPRLAEEAKRRSLELDPSGKGLLPSEP